MKKVTSIAIVGGGSAGWMMAAYASRMLLGVHVTLIESPKIPTVGVGEATTPMLHNFMWELGFTSPEQWMPECNATFKTGISFENWFEQGDHYWHPFEFLDYVDTHRHTGHCWLAQYGDGRGGYRDRARSSFYERYFCSTTLNLGQNRAPLYSELLAYHFDAARFAALLRSVSRQVTHVLDEVVEVELNEQGEIAALLTSEHGRVVADLYVDCTGFRRQLMRSVSSEQFVDFKASLFNDRAAVVRVPYLEKSALEEQMHPYVKASAQSAGWIWTIPLFDKLSMGYVYSSAFISDSDAERELERQCGSRIEQATQQLLVRFETGKLPRLWVKNVVALGLSGGFVEPLESSGLAITQVGIDLLVSMLDARYYDRGCIERYNAYLDKFYLDIIHFITAHYCLTSREDSPYWAAVKNETFVPPGLEARFEVFKRHLPTLYTKGVREVGSAFRDISWFCVLLGMNFPFEVPKVPERLLEKDVQIAREKRRRAKDMAATVPNHYVHLARDIHRKRPA